MVTLERFLEVWRSSRNAAHAARRLGITVGACNSRAWKLREGGRVLRRFPAGRPRKSVAVTRRPKMACEK